MSQGSVVSSSLESARPDPQHLPASLGVGRDTLNGGDRDAGKHIGEPSLRIDVVELGGGDEGVHRPRRARRRAQSRRTAMIFCRAPRA